MSETSQEFIAKFRAKWQAEGRNAVISEMNQLQSAETCKLGHPRWALVATTGWAATGQPKPQECSICAEVAKVEAERDVLRTFIQNRVITLDVLKVGPKLLTDAKAAITRKEEKPHAIQE